MTRFNVHLYREMRLFFVDVEAESPEAAAVVVADRAIHEADDVQDCHGENLSAIVDVEGDEDFARSVTVEFDAERQRKAAPKLLAALTALLPYAENEASCLETLKDGPESETEAEREWKALESAQSLIAAMGTGRPTPLPVTPEAPARFAFEHHQEENSDGAYVLVDGRLDVAIVRTAEGIVINVYPKDGIDPINTLTVWDEDVAAAAADNPAGEA